MVNWDYLARYSFFLFAVLVFRHFREVKTSKPQGFFLFSVLPLLGLIILTSFTKRVYANWPLPIYLGLALFLVNLIHTKPRLLESKEKSIKLAIFSKHSS